MMKVIELRMQVFLNSITFTGKKNIRTKTIFFSCIFWLHHPKLEDNILHHKKKHFERLSDIFFEDRFSETHQTGKLKLEGD